MRAFIDELGGEEVLHQLVNRFYDRMESDPEVHELHRLHFRGHGLNHTRQAQFEFLCGFLGGRQYYRERFGHMNLREIHAHVPIRQNDVEMWLDTFDKALEDCALRGAAVDKLRATLTRAANMLANDVPDWRVASG
ncbi:group II truncated hemoglobin [Pacificoceanicola onchidii]|uniref:group II truncated hemoglobin n=1 Tax=Pacificoceanicola onchidii TaxID=2562685 RepID=UPI0010A553DA|nr:group II truncated hemoglobin [Pacificoceanicola onchidii]